MGNSGAEKTQASIIKILTRLILLLALAGLLTLSLLFINWLNKPGNFPLKKIELVNQLKNQESKELRQVTENVLNGGFFSLNVDELRANLLAELPWVKSVSVRKVWPDKLLIKIIEYKPVARWLSVENNNISEQTQLLSQYGVVFSPRLTEKQRLKFAQLALLMGTNNNAERVLTNCVQIINKLKQLGLGIKRCGMNERRSWMLKLIVDDEMNIKLGKEKIMHQLERFIEVFSGQLKRYLGSVKTADLRYSNGFSIKWKSVGSVTNTLDSSLQNSTLIKKAGNRDI